MLDNLAPARRRLVLGVAALVVLALVAAVTIALLRRPDPVTPVAQDEPGPVLLVPGFGGSTQALPVMESYLVSLGRDVEVVDLPGDATGDLVEQAETLADDVSAALDRTGAPSVDLVGYSAGGVVVRYYVAELGGGDTVRRAVTLGSPHHGTDVAALAVGVGGGTCPEACQELDPDSDLLRGLNQGDETPPGPAWTAIWTEDDQTVVPPQSGSLAGALDYSVQDVCPGAVVAHADLPNTPGVVLMVAASLEAGPPARPGTEVCSAG